MYLFPFKWPLVAENLRRIPFQNGRRTQLEDISLESCFPADGIVPEQERSMKTPSFISLWIVALCFLKTVYSCYLPYLSE
ncbi:hypothetical protein TNCT_148021 [Trichonephila clavata]|uniref:Uncharacterized protein n=1 Tax=Trichonephila clavata TaxID=2740835 RepID=A0A8X6IHP3_TRICU|nr:hypothetical protein TNCT_148021 [Trichonephila clavata]